MNDKLAESRLNYVSGERLTSDLLQKVRMARESAIDRRSREVPASSLILGVCEMFASKVKVEATGGARVAASENGDLGRQGGGGSYWHAWYSRYVSVYDFCL